MATKSLVSATATRGTEEGGRQGREAPAVPGCHPRARPRVPRLRPPPLAAASARETGRSGADETRGERERARRPRPPPPRAHPSGARNAPNSNWQGGARDTPPNKVPPDAPSLGTWKFLETGNIGALPPAPDPLPPGSGGLTRGARQGASAPRAQRSGSPVGGARREPVPSARKERREGGRQRGRAGRVGERR